MLKVAIIGTGPAGMLAAWGVQQEVIAKITLIKPPGVPLKSEIYGAQYVHGIIQDLPADIEPFWVRYRFFGTEQGYRQHIYGETMPTNSTSWRKFHPKELAWSIRQVYDHIAEELVSTCTIEEAVVREDYCEVLVDNYDYVFNTAPLNRVANSGVFETEKVLIAPINPYIVPSNEIWYFGDGRLAYRASNIQGVPSTEYPLHVGDDLTKKIQRQVKEIKKPLRCKDVAMEGVYRLGRYGKWQKGVLVHHVYEEARTIVSRGLPWTATLPA